MDEKAGETKAVDVHATRRVFMEGTGLLGLSLVMGWATPALPATQTMAGSAPQAAKPLMNTAAQLPGRIFFTDEEAPLVEALVARIIPSDGDGPGAIEAGVPNYMDKALGGLWGAGENLYKSGPFDPKAIPELGYQLPYTPADLFRKALRGLSDHFKSSGRSFAQMTPDEQDSFIAEQLEGGAIGDLDGIPAKEFFAQLLDYTVQGYFCDPAYGGNKDMVAWKAIGFPGAYDAYANTVGQHGQRFTLGPFSLLDHDVMPMADMESMEQQK